MIREMKKRSETYKKYNFIDVIYSLVDAYKRSRKYPDKNKVRSLTPIKGAYSGYFLNKVEFEDPRDGKVYKDDWKRNHIDDEADRLKVIQKMNKRIQDYNKFAKEHEKALGIDRIFEQKYYPRNEYPEWSLALHLSHPTIKRTDDVILNRTINNHWFYQLATKIPREEYILRFNKTIYDWIIDMLPKSFNDNSTKFLSDKHILYEPKLEFENWFMKNGMLINDSPSLFDNFEGEKGEGISELEIYKNEARVTTKKLKEMTHKYRLAKEPYRAKVQMMFEEGTLETWIDENCRKKNNKLNLAEMGRLLGCHADTAKKVLRQTGLAYLFDDSKNTYLE